MAEKLDILKENELKILLGKNQNRDYLDENVFWEPLKQHNPHLLISGISGSGKTEALRTICTELKRYKIPVLIFDFHNDFTDFAEKIVDEDNLKIHPLNILIGEKPKDVAHKVSFILRKSFKELTVIQEGVIRKAILQFYLDSGIKDLESPNLGGYKLKPFKDFRDYIELVCLNKTTVESIKIKLDILFDYDLFSKSEYSDFSIEDLIEKSTVFQLKRAPSDEVKRLVSEIMISKLIQYCYQLEQTKKIRLYCIIDEAHRMVYPGSPLDTLFRESRKYGIGVILASQRATDFKETILSQTGTIITLRQNLIKDATYISKNRFGDDAKLMHARPGEGYLKMSSQDNAIYLQINMMRKS